MRLPSISEKTTILTSSSVISLLSSILYLETTKNAEIYQRVSTISANIIINFLAAKNSIDYLIKLYKNSEYKKGLFIFILASAMYLPQVLISILESPYKIGFTIFAAIAAFLSGSALYTYSLIGLGDFLVTQKNDLRIRLPYHLYKLTGELNRDDFYRYQKLISNLDIFVNNVIHRNPESESNHETLIASLTNFTPNLNENRTSFSVFSCLIMTIKFFIQVLLSLVLLYSTIGYTCGAEKSLRENLHFSDDLAMIASNILMLCMYILNVKAGFTLLSSLFEYAVNCFKSKNESDNSVDSISVPITSGNLVSEAETLESIEKQNKLKNIISICVSLASIFIASCSGASAKNLYTTTCPESKMKAMMFDGGSTFVYYSECADNAIYVAISLFLILSCIRNLEKTEDLSMLNMAKKLFKKIKSTTNFDEIRDVIGHENFKRYTLFNPSDATNNSITVVAERYEC